LARHETREDSSPRRSSIGVADTFLLDTGFIVALLDVRDPDHAACADTWREVRGEFISVEGTIVEASHLLANRPEAVALVVALGRRVGLKLGAPSVARTDRAVELMARYRDVPMDYVDADLVALAEEQGVHNVLTVDVRGFSAFRMRDRRAFTIWPNPSTLTGGRARSKRRRRRRRFA
jgi:predicted nucleic acid-binding protein